MKPRSLALIALLGLAAGRLVGQQAESSAPVVEVSPAPAADAAVPAPAGAPEAVDAAAGGPAAGPTQMGEQDDGYWLKDANLNDVLQFLAKKANKQYFHTPSLEGPAYKVTGHLNGQDPEASMEALSFQYGFELYRKGDTIYALSQAQVTQLPQEHFVYQLRYLRPSDIDQIKGLIQPALTPASGIVNFEPKTNTLLIIDTAKRIQVVQDLMAKLDQPKGQIIIETKILRVTSSAGSKIGVDWTSTLGDGITFEAQQSLNGLFNLPEYRRDLETPQNSIGYQFDTGSTDRRRNTSQSFSVDPVTGVRTLSPLTGTETNASQWTSVLNELRVQGAGLVLSPMEVSAVLRALNDGNLAKQKSNPTIITEDNETASVSILDRVPIVTATATLLNGVSQITEEVRYRIDEDDSTDPEDTREIGVTVSVTPTLLPDNTVRMALRPRTAQIVEFIEGAPLPGTTSGNKYPRVAEATIQTIARVPNGYSLLIGGFYNEEETDKENKVPVLGDMPLLNFFFRSKEKSKQQTSLVFIITPTSYDPVGAVETLNVTDQLMDRLDLRADHDSINPDAPGAAHKPGLRRTMRGILFDAFPGTKPQDTMEEELPTLPGYEPLPPEAPAPKAGKATPPAGMTARQAPPAGPVAPVPPPPAPEAPKKSPRPSALPEATATPATKANTPNSKPAPTPLFR